MDYYAILEITSEATAVEVKDAYRRMSKKYHPDLNDNSPYYTEQFIRVKEAYDVLRDEERRRAYDTTRTVFRGSSVIYQSTNARQQVRVPVIYSFTSELPYFFEGDIINLNWNCGYADTIRILPFGYVTSLSGKSSYRINNYKKRYLAVELIASDSKSGRRVSQRIILENGLYRKFTESEQRASEGIYSALEEPWFKSFINPVGRMSRKMYTMRTLILGGIWFLSYVLQGKGVSESLFILVTILFSFIFLIQTARRFQDIGWSPVFSFLMMIPYVNLMTYLALLYFKGNSGANRFGRPVK